MQVHRGVRTLKCTPEYIKHKSNCVTRTHTHGRGHTMQAHTSREGVNEKKNKVRCFPANSSMCVHVYYGMERL